MIPFYPPRASLPAWPVRTSAPLVRPPLRYPIAAFFRTVVYIPPRASIAAHSKYLLPRTETHRTASSACGRSSLMRFFSARRSAQLNFRGSSSSGCSDSVHWMGVRLGRFLCHALRFGRGHSRFLYLFSRLGLLALHWTAHRLFYRLLRNGFARLFHRRGLGALRSWLLIGSCNRKGDLLPPAARATGGLPAKFLPRKSRRGAYWSFYPFLFPLSHLVTIPLRWRATS